jgi:hypothetical protein
MATGQTRNDDTADDPVACALASADRTAQLSRWKQAAEQAMTQRTPTARGFRVLFGSGVEDSVRQLAAEENECCAWATWTVDKHDGELVLDVSSATEGGIAALHSMLTGFQLQGSPDSHAITA